MQPHVASHGAVRSDKAAAFLSRYNDMRVHGAELQQDEIYTHETQGSYNVTRIQAAFDGLARRGREWPVCTAPITENLIEVNALADVSMKRVHAMPLSLCYEKPVLLIELPDGSSIIADGNHRMRRLILARAASFPFRQIPWDMAQMFRVRVEFRRAADGVWEEPNVGEVLELSWGHFDHHKRY